MTFVVVVVFFFVPVPVFFVRDGVVLLVLAIVLASIDVMEGLIEEGDVSMAVRHLLACFDGALVGLEGPLVCTKYGVNEGVDVFVLWYGGGGEVGGGRSGCARGVLLDGDVNLWRKRGRCMARLHAI